jgi:aryl-alcohol dehydrogenase-like predicted oxidoreductase/predicted kinase/histidinol phosphatase-like enzyme
MPARPAPADRPLAIGCMRLSTAVNVDEQRAIAVLHAALDAGVTLLDTADVYAPNESDLGHNERLIARALASWPGDASRVRVATKGGLTRPGGRWVPDGRARHLAAACAASRRALGIERIDLYQLHAADPRVPLATSVRALAALQRDGWIGDIGLCNVTLPQLREALELAPIAAVQVELSPWRDGALRGGLVQECAARGIQLLAYRPFGGVERASRIGRDPTLRAVAERHDATPWEATLAWLRDLAPVVTPLPGPTRAATVTSVAHSVTLALDATDRAALDRGFPAGRQLREPRTPRAGGAMAGDEVVLVIGMPGAGKSTLAVELTARGYARLSRDLRGGRLRDLLPALDELLGSGQRRVVLDNTYATRAARNEVLEVASSHGVPVRCLWLTTTLAEAQVNVASRMMTGGGANAVPLRPDVLYRYQRELEPPEPEEGFAAIEEVPFVRRRDAAHAGRALICWLDGVVRRSRRGARAPVSAEDVEILPGVAAVLAGYRGEGFTLAGLSWHPEVAAGTLSGETLAEIQARTAALLGGGVDLLHCPHGAGPARCWCRKPLPGLGVELIARHRLDPARSFFVGRDATDRSFAASLGFVYRDARDVFPQTLAAASPDGSG